jgi:hypothetical protein
MAHDESDLAFRRQVDEWTLAAVEQDVADFDGLVCATPGVYPPIVAASLDRLRADGAVSETRYADVRSRRTTPRYQGRAVGTPPVLPPPHPLDFDWRYTDQTVERLLQLAASLTQPGDTIALLGTPSVYAASRTCGIDREWVLLDACETTVRHLQATRQPGTVHVCDVSASEIPDLRAAAVVADPPWYPQHIEGFLWAATVCTRPGSAILMSLPPMGTRPGMTSERREFRRAAAAHGIQVEAIHPNGLSYTTPPFEQNALAAAGWHDLPVDWRSGDLAHLRRIGAGVEPRPSLPPSRGEWEEVMLGWSRIRVRTTEPAGEFGCSLWPLVPGGVLDDVSSRHPIRGSANVWTSGNRVYRTDAPQTVLAMLRAMASGSNARDAAAATIGRMPSRVEERTIVRTVRDLTAIVHTEEQELARWGWAGDVGVAAKRAS